MKINSSLKEKKRYIKYKLEPEVEPIKARNTVRTKFKEMFGLNGLADAGLQFIKTSNKDGIIRVNNKYENNLKTIFVMIDEFKIYSIRTSGILNKVLN